jgi:hypothetical protein
MSDQAPTISIVVPTLNEAANISVVLPALPEVHEVILVDGHSVDGTVEAAQRVRPGVKIIHQTRRGKGNALACGFAAATGDIIVMFDADGSADPAEIPAFVRALTGGADYAKGSRFCRSGLAPRGSEDISPLRKLGNGGLNALANLLFGTRYSDLCYGYNAFWRRILPVLQLPPVSAPDSDPDSDPDRNPDRDPDRLLWGDGFEIETVLSCRVAAARLRVEEVPSLERRRIFGDTNLRTFLDGSRVLRTILCERLSAQYRNPGASSIADDLEMRSRVQAEGVAGALTMLDPTGRRRGSSLARLHESARSHCGPAEAGGPRSFLSGLWRAGSRTKGRTQ